MLDQLAFAERSVCKHHHNKDEPTKSSVEDEVSLEYPP
jgi:hypothetical protein